MVDRFAARARRCSPVAKRERHRARAHRRARRTSRASAREEPGRAREIQQENAEKFQRAFERGLAVTGFERTETEGTYLLEPWQ